MNSKVDDCVIILRRWNRETGLVETPLAFDSLDELFALCLAATDPALVDRIIIRGRDGGGVPQIVTFTFQSITVTPKPG